VYRLFTGLVLACGVHFAHAQQLVQNFDNVPGLTGAGWTFVNNSTAGGSTTWFQGNSAVFSAQAGAADSYLAANFNAAPFGGNISLWALTPTLTNLQNGVTVSFYTRTETGSPAPDRMEVRLSLNGASADVGATDTSVGDFSTVLQAINAGQASGGYPETWTQYNVVLAGLPAGVSTGRIGFRYFVTDTAVNGDYIGIDSLVVSDGPPDLTIAKTHTGTFAQGQIGATYTIVVSNAGGQPTVGAVNLLDTLPAGLTSTAMTGTGWTCAVPALTCTRSDALAPGASYPPITLTVNVASNAPASVTNTVTVSGGGEVDTSNNTATDPTVITALQLPDLTIVKTHAGNFRQGQIGATYSIAVGNAGPGPTSDIVTVVDTLPAGLTASGITGPGWSCTLGTLTCTRADVLAAGGSYPVITLTVDVAPTAPASVTNVATVSGGGESNPANNTSSDVTTIAPTVADLSITKTHSGSFTQGQVGALYTIVVSNAGPDATSGAVQVVDTLPAGLTATALGGSGWTCALNQLTCIRSDPLAVAASYPAITLTVNVAADAPASVINVATVSGGGDATPGNSTARDTTVIVAAAPVSNVPIPTLSEWAMLLLTALLALGGAMALRRRA